MVGKFVTQRTPLGHTLSRVCGANQYSCLILLDCTFQIYHMYLHAWSYAKYFIYMYYRGFTWLLLSHDNVHTDAAGNNK